MKNRLLLGLYAASIGFVVAGCSLTPYQSEFSCVKGVNSGVCDSVSNVYQRTLAKDKLDVVSDSSKVTLTDDATTEIRKKCKAFRPKFFTTHHHNHYKHKDDAEYLKCIEREIEKLNEAHELESSVYSKMVEYQQMRNEQLNQKNQLIQAKNY